MKNRRNESILKSAIAVTLVTLFIKFLGLVKQTIIASKCGANIDTDAFYISTGIFGQLAIIIFSTLSITLLTEYTNVKEKKSEKDAYGLINNVLKIFLPISIIISIVSFVFCPLIASFLAPSYSIVDRDILVQYMKISTLLFVPYCYYLILNVILENEKKFIPGKLLGFFQNIFIISSVLFFYNRLGAKGLVISFILAAFFESVIVTIALRNKLRYIFSGKGLQYKHEMIKLFKLSIPIIVGNAVFEINDIIDKKISTNLGSGYASLLTYGSTINDLVVGIVVSSIAAVLFANFATWVAKKDEKKITNCLTSSINILNLILVPVTLLCLFYNYNIASFFYGHGNLDKTSLFIVGTVIVGYAIGFCFQMYRSLFTKILYAFQDTKFAMYNGFLSIVLNVLLSIILAKKIGLLGVSLATSLSMIVSTIIMGWKVKKYLPNANVNKTFVIGLKYLAICAFICFCIYNINEILISNIIIQMIVSCVVVIILYITFLIIIKDNIVIGLKEKLLYFINSKRSGNLK